MFATLFSATLIFSIAIHSVLAEFDMATPNLVQCEKASVTWSKATAPYNLAVMPAADPCGDPLADLGDHNGTSMQWAVSLPAGTQVVFSLLDSDGDEAWSGEITIQGSNDTSCLASTSSTASATASDPVHTSSTATGTASVPSTSIGSNVAGAANAGNDPSSSSALSTRHIPGAASLLGAIAAVAAVAL